MIGFQAKMTLVASLCLMASTARAHVGASVAVARFSAPADAVIAHGEPNDTIAPLSIATADQSFTISWTDGDTDPTGRFTFYYLDHQPNFQVLVTDIEAGLGTKIDDPSNLTGGYFASCSCSSDMGVTCPPDVRDPNGNCANQLAWNTQAIPAGTYWIAAVNNDPPFHVYNISNSPIRVAHAGAGAAPALIVMRPDGFGTADTTYRVQWLASGKAPFNFDISYGVADTGTALQPSGTAATAVAATDNADGTFSYDWDVSALVNGPYWVRVKATDADGTSTFTDSRFAVTVFHPTMTPPAAPDMAMLTMPKGGCTIENGADPFAPALLSIAALIGIAIIARRIVKKRE